MSNDLILELDGFWPSHMTQKAWQESYAGQLMRRAADELTKAQNAKSTDEQRAELWWKYVDTYFSKFSSPMPFEHALDAVTFADLMLEKAEERGFA
jgi:hypothetical protein